MIRRLLVLTLSVSVATALAGCDGAGSSTAPTGGGALQSGGKSKHKLEAPPPIQPVK
jgi:hypothetical protein